MERRFPLTLVCGRGPEFPAGEIRVGPHLRTFSQGLRGPKGAQEGYKGRDFKLFGAGESSWCTGGGRGIFRSQPVFEAPGKKDPAFGGEVPHG